MNYPKKNVALAHGLIQINGYLRRGLHLKRFDPYRRFIEPRIWIYAGITYNHKIKGDTPYHILIEVILSSIESMTMTKYLMLKEQGNNMEDKRFTKIASKSNQNHLQLK